MSGSRSTSCKRPLLILVAFAFLIACAFVNKRSREVTSVRLIVPDNFTGIIKLRFGSAAGVQVHRRGGEMKFVIPPDGKLDVAGRNVQFDWHRLNASYLNGTPIVEIDPAIQSSHREDQLVHIWEFANPVPPAGDNEAWFFVGTEAEYKAYAGRKIGE
jgi:hypothetical protein